MSSSSPSLRSWPAAPRTHVFLWSRASSYCPGRQMFSGCSRRGGTRTTSSFATALRHNRPTDHRARTHRRRGGLRLHYGDPQITIGVVFAVLALLLAIAFVVIAVQAGSEVGFERVHDIGYSLRKRWLAILVVVGVIVVGISLFDLPYASGGAG